MIWRPPLRRLTLGLTLVVVATAFEALAVATVLPITLKQLGGLAWYGWTFSAFLLANLVGISVGGSETERVGLARLFAIAVVLFSGGLIVSGVAPAMQVIVAGRVLQGFGAGLLSTVAYAGIAKAYAVELQPRMLATLSTAWVVPGLVGPALAGLIAEHASWRWVFLGLVPMLLMAALLVLPALGALRAETERVSGPRGERILQAIQLGVGTSAALAGLGERRWSIAVGLIVGGGMIAVRALAKLLPAGTLVARRGQPAAVATMTFVTFAFFGAEAFLPLALSHVRQASVIVSGLALTAAALTWTAGAWLPVRLAGRVSRRAIIQAGLLILAVGLALTAGLLVREIPAAFAIVAWAVAGLGMGLAFTTTSAAILEAAGPGEAGAGSAALQLAQVLGAGIATGLGGAIVAGHEVAVGIAIVDAIMIAGVGVALWTGGRVRTHERPRDLGAAH